MVTTSEYAEATNSFITQHVLPVEDEFGGDVEVAGGDDLRMRLQALAREAGVFAPHVFPELGGRGLNMVERASVFEEAGYSLFGPMALNIAAPDKGNMHLLAHVGTPEQKEQTFGPLRRQQSAPEFIGDPGTPVEQPGALA